MSRPHSSAKIRTSGVIDRAEYERDLSHQVRRACERFLASRGIFAGEFNGPPTATPETPASKQHDGTHGDGLQKSGENQPDTEHTALSLSTTIHDEIPATTNQQKKII